MRNHHIRLLFTIMLIASAAALTGCPQSASPPGVDVDADGGASSATPSGTIRISGAWALYPMTVKWVEEYRAIHPEVRIDVSAGGAGKGVADALGGMVDIGMVSRAIRPEEISKGGWFVSVARDSVFPIASEANPVLEQLRETGVTRETFAAIWMTGEVTTWGQAAGTENTETLSVYTRSDACGAAETWARFLGGEQEDLGGTGVYGDPGLTEAIRKDPLGIGFANLNYAYDPKTDLPIEGIFIVPLDVNGNGRLDEDEDFYATGDQVVQALSEGRYPSPPMRDLYLLCKSAPEGATRDFITWVLTEGQKYVREAGFVPLDDETLAAEMKKLEQQ
ncbi:MAG: phosphate ABC transporter substrate-binding protein [candidate division WS1 bacterium]|nr:phosphate ABC transporter substrate-binding protein [candidate division WS1 bacterium]